MRSLLTCLLPSILLGALTSSCMGGFHSEDHAYSDLVDHQSVLSQASDLEHDLTVGGVSYDWRGGTNGYHVQTTCPGSLELEPADVEPFVADLEAYLREDIFGWGFYLDEEGCKVDTRTVVPGLKERARIELAWESATGKGRLELTLNDGARTGLYDLYFLIDESSL